MNNIKPLTPDEVKKKSQALIPDEVFESVNELLCKHVIDGNTIICATIRQTDIITLVVEKYNQNHPGNKITRNNVFDNRWLNFEESYRSAGWKVSYDKPGYNESYEPTFDFSNK